MSHEALNRELQQSAQNSRALPLRAESESDEWESESDHTGDGFSSSFRLKKLEGTPQHSLGTGERERLETENIESGSLGRRRSDDTEGNFLLYTPDEERSVVAKFDRRLVLFIALLYMLSFLDRSSRSIAFIHLTGQLIDYH